MSEMIDIAMQGMKDSYDSGYKDSRSLLKYPHTIIEFIDSCGFDSEQLGRIIRGIEELKGSDYEGNPEIDMTDSLREQNGEFDRILF